MRVLVTGGAGYIGSVVVEQLLLRGVDVRIVDDLSKGHGGAVPDGVPLHVVDLLDEDAVVPLLAGVDGVIHLAAESLVGESLEEPVRYFRSNVSTTVALLRAMRRASIARIVFSSTAAVYGEPKSSPIVEDQVERPLNPYGESKLAAERLLEWTADAGEIGFVTLRYFNAAGATAEHGEDHDPETHLIPIVLRAALDGGPPVPVFGTDYPTPDGTCVRDYVHVEDIAAAHVAALDRLALGDKLVVNVGTSTGTSVREVLDVARRVTGRAIPAREAPRRPGDPPVLVASGEKARSLLGVTASRPDVGDIVESAWRWLVAHPTGYAGAAPAGRRS